MRHYPDKRNKDDKQQLEKIKAEPWMVGLLKLNPSYVFWGPHEDYMGNKDGGWSAPVICKSWKEFGPWKLDELNEVVNFYFEVDRESKECPACDRCGYNKETKKIYDDYYDFANTGRKWIHNITQDEVNALVKQGRIKKYNGKNPTASEINEEYKKGFGHDAINCCILIRTRAKRLGVYGKCEDCKGDGYTYTTPSAHVNLVLWVIHPRKGCSRGVEVRIQNEDLPAVFAFLKEAEYRNRTRFRKIKSTKFEDRLEEVAS